MRCLGPGQSKRAFITSHVSAHWVNLHFIGLLVFNLDFCGIEIILKSTNIENLTGPEGTRKGMIKVKDCYGSSSHRC